MNFGSGQKAVDRLLKALLPVAKAVYQQQEREKATAKSAVELRKKRELMQQRNKEAEEIENQKYSLS